MNREFRAEIETEPGNMQLDSRRFWPLRDLVEQIDLCEDLDHPLDGSLANLGSFGDESDRWITIPIGVRLVSDQYKYTLRGQVPEPRVICLGHDLVTQLAPLFDKPVFICSGTFPLA
jgi:hypothetical protein